MAIRLERMLRFCNTTRFSMLDQQWDVIDIISLRGEYAQPPMMSTDLVVRLEPADPSLSMPVEQQQITDWGWDFMTFLRKPLDYSSILYSMRMKSEPQHIETARVTYAFDAFDLFLPTAMAPCWLMFDIEKMELGFTFMNEQDAIAFEALRLAFPVEFPPA